MRSFKIYLIYLATGITLAASLIVSRAGYRTNQVIAFGNGLVPPNPASERALVVTDEFLIAGDQEAGMTREGSVYVFTNNAGTWSLSQRLTDCRGTVSRGWFGYTLDLSGDWLAVGSTHSGAFNDGGEGDVQMFELDPETRLFEFRQIIHDGAGTLVGTEFGSTLDLSGDWMLIGGPWHDWGGSNVLSEGRWLSVGGIPSAGAAWFYENVDGVWINRQIESPDPQIYGQYGFSVAVDGTNALISAYRSGTGNYGYVYWYTLESLESNVWSFRSSIQHSNWPIAGETFGNNLVLQGTNLVALASTDGQPVIRGRAYFFQLLDGNWVEVDSYFPDDVTVKGRWGIGAHLNDPWLIVSGRHEDPLSTTNWNMPAKGKAYVFKRKGSNWSLTDILAPVDRQMGDWFGSDLCISADGRRVWAISPGAYRDGVKTNVLYEFTLVPETPLMSIQLTEGSVELGWTTDDTTSVAPRYTVEVATNLVSSNWIEASGPIWPISTNSVSLPRNQNEEATFFRVKIGSTD